MKRLLFALLPARVIRRLQDFRRLEWAARRQYVKAAVGRATGLRSETLPHARDRSGAIVFICHGNIIRSPMAEYLLRDRLTKRGSQRRVSSAGMHARGGRSADVRALRLASAFGVSLDAHVAQPLTRALVDDASVLFVMDYKNEADVLARFPDSREKVVLLGAFARDGGPDGPSIPDPYEGNSADVERCYRRLVRAVDAVVEVLVSDDEGPSGPH